MSETIFSVESGDTLDFACGYTYSYGPVFYCPADFEITEVHIYLKRVYNPDGEDVNVDLYRADEDGLITGSILSTGSGSTAGLSTSTPTWYQVNMSSYNLSVGLKYILAFWSNSPRYFQVRGTADLETTDPVIGNSYTANHWSTSTMQNSKGFELLFKVVGNYGASAYLLRTGWIGYIYQNATLRQTATWRAQTFTTPADGFTMTRFDTRLLRSAGASGTVYADLFATDGSGHPTGSALATSSIDASTLTTNSVGAMTPFTFSYALSGSTKYAMSFRTDATADNVVSIRRSPSATYSRYGGGNYEVSADQGSSWTTYTAYEHEFSIYSEFRSTAGAAQAFHHYQKLARG